MVQLYYDKELTSVIEGYEIRLGVTEVGKTNNKTIYVHNPSNASIEDFSIVLESSIEGFSISDVPYQIGAWKTVPIRIIWSPSLTLRKALKIKIYIIGKEVYYA